METLTPQQLEAVNRFVEAWSRGERVTLDHEAVLGLSRVGINDLRSSVGEMFLSSDGISNRPLNFWDPACDRISMFSNGRFLVEVRRGRRP